MPPPLPNRSPCAGEPLFLPPFVAATARHTNSSPSCDAPHPPPTLGSSCPAVIVSIVPHMEINCFKHRKNSKLRDRILDCSRREGVLFPPWGSITSPGDHRSARGRGKGEAPRLEEDEEGKRTWVKNAVSHHVCGTYAVLCTCCILILPLACGIMHLLQTIFLCKYNLQTFPFKHGYHLQVILVFFFG